ncbi:MAG TPA: ATP-binding protein [Vicinamibacteria bacterium]
MTGGEVPRPDVESPLLSRARSSPPFLLTGPPGSGKTSLLLSLRDALSREGFQPVYLDLMAAASSPDRFVRAALDVLPAEPFSKHLPEAMCIRQIADSGRIHGVEAVRALFSLWGALAHAHGRPVVLLLDEVTEIRSLAYFSGLREVHEMLGAALQARSGGTVLATSFPTRARRYWPAWSTLEARPLEERDVAGLGRSAAGAVRAGFGWPRYVRVLRDRLRQGDDLLAAWTEEMSTGGRLETACRQTYESLLLRSRGYGISKAVLQAVAHEEGSNLSSLVTRLGRTPGATRDYLQWLVAVDALRVVRKRYFYVDGLLRTWVRLHARGWPATEAEIAAAARAALEGEERRAVASGAPAGSVEVPEPALPARRDSLIEID